MSEQNAAQRAALLERWRTRWSDFLEGIEDAVASDDESMRIERLSERLRDKRTIGNAERKIAGGHEGREILELLQNARDAIRGSDGRGRVYVGVFDRGIVVANSGSRFDLFDDEVEDAVTMIGETGKGDEVADEQAIGHKGVGLKSVLATGEAFEIHTRPVRDDSSVFSVRLSRAYILGALLARMGHSIDFDELLSGVTPQGLHETIREMNGLVLDGPLEDDELLEDLSKLPLFQFPLPVDLDGDEGNLVHDRIDQLLQGEWSSGGVGDGDEARAYRTAVFVEFEDSDWGRIRGDDIEKPEDHEHDADERPEEVWEYLSGVGDGESLLPETVVQLGEIDELVLERAFGNGAEVVHWSIRREQGDFESTDLDYERVSVGIEADGDPLDDYEYDRWSYRGDGEHDCSLLIDTQQDSNEGDFPSEYPLYLYYPIEATTDARLPYCLHGRFKVETNRKALSRRNEQHNTRVLDEATELIGDVAEYTASRPDGPFEDGLYPWILLPPIPDEQVSVGNPISSFLTDGYELLSEATCVPSETGNAQRPSESLLHWNPGVIAGYLGFFDISNQLGLESEDPLTEGQRPLPSRAALHGLRPFPEEWVGRIRLAIGTENPTAETGDLLDRWVSRLSRDMSGDELDDGAVICGAAAAGDLLTGLAELYQEGSSQEGELESKLEDHAGVLDGVHLLPCQGAEEGGDVQLVRFEQRPDQGGRRERGAHSRSVMWNLRTQSGDSRPPAPPAGSSFTVYFLDESVETNDRVRSVLEVAGDSWGIRKYEDFPSYYRSLLDIFAFGSVEALRPTDLEFLVDIEPDLSSDSEDLRNSEGAFAAQGLIQAAIRQTDGDRRRNVNRRLQLRECWVQPRPGDSFSIRDDVIDRRWYELVRDVDEDAPQSSVSCAEVSESMDGLIWDWPGPSDECWDPFIDDDTEEAQRNLAGTVTRLGALGLPGIRTLWMYGQDHPSFAGRGTVVDWDPRVWEHPEDEGLRASRVEELNEIISGTGYLDLISGPGFHPGDSARHSSDCRVKTEGQFHRANLAMWLWTSHDDWLESHGGTVRRWLNGATRGDLLSLLETGWSCEYGGHNRRDWREPVPTVLNWQLRDARIWEDELQVAELQDRWGEDAETLRFAVFSDEGDGERGSRLFPRMTPASSSLPTEVREALGVKSMDEFNVTEAARRLQRLQEVLADGQLGGDQSEPVPLRIPGRLDDHWNQAYRELLEPLLAGLPGESTAGMATIESVWEHLTHLPLKRGERWFSASKAWIIDNAGDEVRRYTARSPKPWERAVAENEYYIFPQPMRVPFARLAEGALGVPAVEVDKPVLDLESGQLVGDDVFGSALEAIRDDLRERRALLIASLNQTRVESIEESRDELDSAINDLEVASRFPPDHAYYSPEYESGVYRHVAGHEALVLNGSQVGDNLVRIQESGDDEDYPSRELAKGMAILFNRPSLEPDFMVALEQNLSPADLEERWRTLGKPIDRVKEVLGERGNEIVHNGFRSIAELVERVDGRKFEVEGLIDAVIQVDGLEPSLVSDWFLHEGVTSPDEHLEPSSIEKFKDLMAALPSSLRAIAALAFDTTASRDEWISAIEQAALADEVEVEVIGWLQDRRNELRVRAFPGGCLGRLERVTHLVRVFERTEPDEHTDLGDPEMLASRLDEIECPSLTWSDRMTEAEGYLEESPPRIAFLTIGNRCEELCNRLVDELVEGIQEPGLRDILQAYIWDKERPSRSGSASAERHQQRALRDVSSYLSRNPEFDWGSLTDLTDAGVGAEGSLEVSVGGDRRGGGSQEFRGRGQQAEAFVLTTILDRLTSWIEQDVEGRLANFRSSFDSLRKEEDDEDYLWHVKRVWRDLEDLTGSGDGSLSVESITDWRHQFFETTDIGELPIVRLLNVTLERGPGFDLIDPLGPLSSEPDDRLNFIPVEVKAVGGEQPPFAFRLTTNEFRQCKAFLSGETSRPYTIRLVHVPEPGTPEWVSDSKVVREYPLRSIEDVEGLVADRSLEEVVKGGYMNLSLE